MIPDTHDGTLREVDVLLRIPVSDRELLVGIECRDHRRPADLQWIEQVKSKYDLLPVDRCVVVSRRGFSRAALARARLWKIEALSLDAATRPQWATRFRDLVSIEVRETHYWPHTARIQFVPVAGRPLGDFNTDAPGMLLHTADGRRLTVQQLVDQSMTPELKRSLDTQHPPPATDVVEFEFGLRTEERLTAKSVDGFEWEVSGIDFFVRHWRESTMTNVEHHDYNGVVIATGRTQSADRLVSVVLAQREKEGVHGTVRVANGGNEVAYDVGSSSRGPRR